VFGILFLLFTKTYEKFNSSSNYFAAKFGLILSNIPGDFERPVFLVIDLEEMFKLDIFDYFP